MVLLSHIVLSHPWYRQHLGNDIFWYLHELGAFGVRIFFCISGFVICRGLLREHDQTSTISVRNFFVRRVFRILPPLALYMAAVFGLTLAGVIMVSGEQFARAGFFACNFQGPVCGWFLGHTWSLSFEEQFYIVFPFAFIYVMRSRFRYAMAALTLSLMIASMLALISRHGRIAEFMVPFCYMLCGCSFALHWQTIAPRLTKLSGRLWATLFLSIVAIVMFQPLHYMVRHLFTVMFEPIALSVVVLATPVTSRWIARIFLNPTIAYFGKISFSIYLWQQLDTANYALTSPVPNLIGLFAVMLISVLSFKYFELPMIGVGAGFCRDTRAASHNAAVATRLS